MCVHFRGFEKRRQRVSSNRLKKFGADFLETKVASIQERENVLKFEGNFNILRWIY
jgi:hypothetical protein